jgi:hypothetical protein
MFYRLCLTNRTIELIGCLMRVSMFLRRDGDLVRNLFQGLLRTQASGQTILLM